MINTTMKYLNIIFIPILICVSTQIGQAQTFGSLYTSNQEGEALFIEKDTNMEQALEAMEERFNILFIYRSKIVKDTRVENEIMLTNGIENTLDKLFEGTDLEYANLKHKTYGIYTRKDDTPESLTLPIFQETVTGTVRDASNGEPLPGVNISILGTTTGTSTNTEGGFEVTVPSLNDTLIFSFIGYQSLELPINGRTNLNVELQTQTIAGEELLVTAFGIEREQKSLTYSTKVVSTEQITEARELSVLSSLKGKVAGLSITSTSSGVGSDTRVTLRGNRSINGSSQPLYVLDGVPIRGNPNDFNPDNIESINVLKGANAAALYGSEAQNGAIVLTTKRGRAGVVDVSFNNTFMVRDPIHSIPLQNEYGQGSEGLYNPRSEASWGPKIEGQMVDHWSPSSSLSGMQYAFIPQPDNVSDIFQKGYNATSNLSASVGSEKTQAMFSYALTNSQGILPENKLTRHNVSVRLSSQLTERLSLDSRVSFMQQVINNSLSSGLVQNIYQMPRNIRINQMKNFEYTDSDGNNRQNFWNPGSNGGVNPYWDLYRELDENTRERVLLFASLVYDFSDALSLMVRTGYDGISGSGENKTYNDTFPNTNFGRYTLSESKSLEWNGDILLSYMKNINDDWNIDANFGGTVKQRRNKSLSASTGEALTLPNFFTISNTQNVIASQSIGSPRDVLSLYSFAQIGWKNSVFLDITGRNDWSSTLPSDSWSYFYPSAGLSVILSDLVPAFPELFNFAKIRVSWAKVGNSAPPFMLERTADFTAGGKAGFLELNDVVPNEELKPEETESFELGLDVRLFEGRLGLDVTAYKTNTRNQLFTVAVPVASGASSFFTNGGDVENKGIELRLTGEPIQNRDFTWNTMFNYGLNRNMVVKISEERPSIIIASDFLRDVIIEENQPFGQVYGRGFVRDSQGRVIVSSDGMPQLTSGKTVPVANFTPDWMGGIMNTLQYKNYSLSFLIDHRQGGTVASDKNSLLDFAGVTKKTLLGRDEGGVVFGEDIFTKEVSVMEDGSPNSTQVNPEAFWRLVGGINAPVAEAFVEDATNTRLRELIIGYTLPPSVLERLPISNLKISIVGRNLFFIYRASESLDPDLLEGTNAAAEGYEPSGAPPTTRSFGVNLKIDF